jgi:4-hydroxyproline epimerase
VELLSDVTKRIRRALQRQGITGASGGEIDHIDLFGPPGNSANHSRNFVLCPGGAYDRSPCGTGTSAKLACLHAASKLKPGEIWRQESILGTLFEGSVRLDGDKLIPRVTGTAYVNSEATLLLDPNDPFQMGIRA